MTPKPKTTEAHERQVVRDAMKRLIDGEPIRSDGKLTVKSLADEAGVKRWLLTHKHPDLQEEFRSRVATQGETPEAHRSLANDNDMLRTRVEELSAELAEARAAADQLARFVQVLTLENGQLRAEANGKGGNVRQIAPRT